MTNNNNRCNVANDKHPPKNKNHEAGYFRSLAFREEHSQQVVGKDSGDLQENFDD